MVAKIRTSGTKGITSSELPHSSQQLSKTSHGQSHAYNGVRDDDASSLSVEEGEDEGDDDEVWNKMENAESDDEHTTSRKKTRAK